MKLIADLNFSSYTIYLYFTLDELNTNEKQHTQKRITLPACLMNKKKQLNPLAYLSLYTCTQEIRLLTYCSCLSRVIILKCYSLSALSKVSFCQQIEML